MPLYTPVHKANQGRLKFLWGMIGWDMSTLVPSVGGRGEGGEESIVLTVPEFLRIRCGTNTRSRTEA